ncbi:MAG TPA: alpha/beta fold hydrolase [Thiobacillus sp.]|nr:alpha/beta fold hydrolase [Thiobacillus sp.]
MNRPHSLLLAALACVLVSLPSFANHGRVVEAKLPSGKIVSADFHGGKSGLPAVLVLHGFLQTHAFPTVASTRDALATAGYTVMAPTLSLGISRRNKSLSCEAVHLHTLDDDAAEVAFWVRWLVRKGHTRIILVGHSFGNLQLLSYMSHAPAPAVKQVVMISLTDVEVKQDAPQRARLAQDLRNRVARGENSLTQVDFGHCKHYVSSPAALLSYLTISRRNILDSLAKSAVPVAVIMGGKDDRMGADWLEKLVSRGFAVRVIPGASHFFDNQYEFDLQEAVLLALPGR